ncbi:MAG TPA: glycosyltransferase [Candidatus Acidoferrales bacterium]|nr:glycosyltransferase [Candidatus Acidoferrales bacterium]
MSQNQRRILHVVGTMDPGGLETSLLHLLAHIDKDRFQFHFCICGTEAGLYAGEVEKLGGKVLMCSKGPDVWLFRRNFQNLLRQGRYDIVHSHVSFFSGALLRWSNEESVPIRIAHSHNAHDGKPRSFSRFCYRRLMRSWIDRYATNGLAVSKPAAAELFGKNWQTDKRFQILYHGLDLRPFQQSFDRDRVRAEFGIPIGAPVVGHVGRFDHSKNHRFILDTAEAVLKRRHDVHFLLIGDGPLRAGIEARSQQLGLSDKIHCIGIRTDVPRLMIAAMDLFFFPSLHEGFGVCLLEAQAAGLRCVVSDSIPRDVVKVPECLDFLALSAGRDYWSARLLQALDARRLKSHPALDTVARTSFSIQRPLRDLMSIYSMGQDPVRLVAAEQHV